MSFISTISRGKYYIISVVNKNRSKNLYWILQAGIWNSFGFFLRSGVWRDTPDGEAIKLDDDSTLLDDDYLYEN